MSFVKKGLVFKLVMMQKSFEIWKISLFAGLAFATWQPGKKLSLYPNTRK